MIKDLCISRNTRPNKLEDKEKPPKILFQFTSKAINRIDFRKIFKNTEVISKWPVSKAIKFATPMAIFKYSAPISSRIFNYRQSVQNADLDSYVNMNYSCACSNSFFKDSHHEHVVT